jgi:hypothetical protein
MLRPRRAADVVNVIPKPGSATMRAQFKSNFDLGPRFGLTVSRPSKLLTRNIQELAIRNCLHPRLAHRFSDESRDTISA